MKKRIIGVVGMGHVGAHVAFVLGMRGAADVVKICDINEQKAISERQDLMDAVLFMPHHVDYVIAKNWVIATLSLMPWARLNCVRRAVVMMKWDLPYRV